MQKTGSKQVPCFSFVMCVHGLKMLAAAVLPNDTSSGSAACCTPALGPSESRLTRTSLPTTTPANNQKN